MSTCPHPRQPHPYKPGDLLPCAWPKCWRGVASMTLHLVKPLPTTSAAHDALLDMEVWCRARAGSDYRWEPRPDFRASGRGAT